MYRLHAWISAALLALIVLFLLSYFEPRLLLSPVTPTGGDTPSHFTTAVYYRDLVLRHFQITGWDYGNLAGYPLFQYYFPFPFLLCAILSIALPISVSFKLVTVLGVFLLPFSAFYFLRRLDFPFPAPVLGAAATLPFLFVEAQSMWGGNIPSTLAGEFTYSLGMAIALLYLAKFFTGIQTGTGVAANVVLLALAGFSHGCALMVAGAVPLVCVVQGADTFRRLKYFLKVNLLAFFLLAFWLLPWVMSQEYMSPFNFLWVFRSWKEVAPPVLAPLYVLALFSGIHLLYTWWRRRQADPRMVYLWFGTLVCAIFFRIGYQINVVDIRFIPFAQIFLILAAAAFAGSLLQRLPASWMLASALVLVTLFWTDWNSATIRGWIQWNNEGFEKKRPWPILQDATRALSGSYSDGRVVYEHSAAHDEFGSIRTFESLPYFSGRATLEGAYLQSSINSPFIFYLQSEVSEVTSCPLPDYHCASLDLARALPHLQLFNVTQLLLRSDAAKAQARGLPQALALQKSAGLLEIYGVLPATGRYVEPLACAPALYTGTDWKREAFRWFRAYTPASVPVAIDRAAAPPDAGRFVSVSSTFPVREQCVPQPPACEVEERVEHDRIRIHTTCIGQPLLVKMSYHPRWQVTGASKVYLATPGFMLVFPERADVELKFGKAWPNTFGSLLTFIGLAILSVRTGTARRLGALGRRLRRGVRDERRQKDTEGSISPAGGQAPAAAARLTALWSRLAGWLQSPAGSRALKGAAAGVPSLCVLAIVLGLPRNDANVLFEKGLEYYFVEDFITAQRYFRQAAQAGPESSFGINGQFYSGLALFRQQLYQPAAEVFRALADEFPESMYAAEATYHVGLSLQLSGASGYETYFRRVLANYPQSRWAGFSRERLDQAKFDLGMRAFDRGDYGAAQVLFLEEAGRVGDAKSRARALYFAAVCDFRRSRWLEAAALFSRLTREHPGSDWVAESMYHLGLCYDSLGQSGRAREHLRAVVRRFGDSRWAGYAAEKLKSM